MCNALTPEPFNYYNKWVKIDLEERDAVILSVHSYALIDAIYVGAILQCSKVSAPSKLHSVKTAIEKKMKKNC